MDAIVFAVLFCLCTVLFISGLWFVKPGTTTQEDEVATSIAGSTDHRRRNVNRKKKKKERNNNAKKKHALSVLCYLGLPGLGKSELTAHLKSVVLEYNAVFFSKDEENHIQAENTKGNMKRLRSKHYAQALCKKVRQHVDANKDVQRTLLVIDQNINREYLKLYLSALRCAGFHIENVACVASELEFAQQQELAVYQAKHRNDKEPKLSLRSTLPSGEAEKVLLQEPYWNNPSVIPTYETFKKWVQSETGTDTDVHRINMPLSTYDKDTSTWQPASDDKLAIFVEDVVVFFAPDLQCTSLSEVLYICVHPDKASKKKLSALAQPHRGTGRNVETDFHLTLIFNPRDCRYRHRFIRYVMWMARSGTKPGNKVEMTLTKLYSSDDPDMLTGSVDLQGLPCGSDVPHITFYYKEGVRPFNSVGVITGGKCQTTTVIDYDGYEEERRALRGDIFVVRA